MELNEKKRFSRPDSGGQVVMLTDVSRMAAWSGLAGTNHLAMRRPARCFSNQRPQALLEPGQSRRDIRFPVEHLPQCAATGQGQ